jgi:Ca2+-binding EF-hand superfamily protein
MRNLAYYVCNAQAFAWIWAGSGWLIFLVGNYFDYHIWRILQNMVASPPSTSEGSSESGALIPSSLPAWTEIDLAQYLENGSWLVRCFGNPTKATRQDTFYWMERKGPKLYLILFQIQLVFTAAYISLLLLTFYPYMFRESNLVKFLFYVVVSLLPVCLLSSKYQTAAANMTTASSIGVHRRPQVVAQVIREEKTDRIIRAMVTMQKLQNAARSGFSSPSTATPTPSTDTVVLAEASKTFDALDKSGDGKIQTSELKNIFKALGAPTTEESLQAIVQLLDKNQDGHISKEEFMSFYSANIRFEHDHHGLHELAHDMFQQFDQDQSGEITLGEFKAVMDAFNVGFTVDEIGDLVNELDEQDNGTIGEHEFLELLETHHHLFQQNKLPPFE